jgi:hypothetical protein
MASTRTPFHPHALFPTERHLTTPRLLLSDWHAADIHLGMQRRCHLHRQVAGFGSSLC